MPEFKPGEIVDVTIKGVRVDDQHPDGTVTVIADHPDGGPAHWQMPPRAVVTRVGPAEWPPQPGDLWRDSVTSVWFALFDNYGNKVVMIPADPTRGLSGFRPDEVLAQGALTLVHREDRDEVSET